jgi:hypothetical protein
MNTRKGEGERAIKPSGEGAQSFYRGVRSGVEQGQERRADLWQQ